jgi:hypothetical protein
LPKAPHYPIESEATVSHKTLRIVAAVVSVAFVLTLALPAFF